MGFSADGRYLVALAGRANGLSPLYSTPEACESNTSAARIAQSIQSLGLQQTLELIDGSFCLAILDRRLHTLSLVRDRIGQCSLYYGWTHQGSVNAACTTAGHIRVLCLLLNSKQSLPLTASVTCSIGMR
ncbi:hypothetical protein KV692_03980 [Xanthomonas euvesicatoria pv. physalidis]|nr:hypothetical protein [Xanthomonas euvesicatoria pv. physalidis]